MRSINTPIFFHFERVSTRRVIWSDVQWLNLRFRAQRVAQHAPKSVQHLQYTSLSPPKDDLFMLSFSVNLSSKLSVLRCQVLSVPSASAFLSTPTAEQPLYGSFARIFRVGYIHQWTSTGWFTVHVNSPPPFLFFGCWTNDKIIWTNR